MLVNGARWLECAVPVFAAWCFVAGCALLVARRAGWSAIPIAEASVFAMLLLAGFAWHRTRQHWFSREDGLVRLEAVLGLHNRLSSAAAGVGDWPHPMLNATSGFHWRWQRLVVPLGCALAFLMAAVLIKITPETAMAAAKIEMPLALTQVETALEELKRDAVTEPEALANIEQKLEALRTQTPEAWYSQGGLEAADALREETGHAVASLERHLDAVSQALSESKLGDGSGAPIAPDKETAWNEALKGLQSGGLPLNKADLAALKQCDGKSGLSAQQLQALQSKLGKDGAACKAAMGTVGEALAKAGTVPNTGSPQDQGGPGGGGDTAPLGMRPLPTDATAQQEQALESKDTEHMALGDVMKVTTGEHKVDPAAAAGPAAGGGVSSAGSGGEAVWKTEVSPKEEAVLRSYFK